MKYLSDISDFISEQWNDRFKGIAISLFVMGIGSWLLFHTAMTAIDEYNEDYLPQQLNHNAVIYAVADDGQTIYLNVNGQRVDYSCSCGGEMSGSTVTVRYTVHRITGTIDVDFVWHN